MSKQNLGVPGVVLAWNASTDTNVVGYYIKYGTASGSYISKTDVGKNTTAVVSGLTPGPTYYFVTTAHDAAGDESPPSNEASFNQSTYGPPTISTQPASQNAGAGATVTFTVAASGTGSFSYQWVENGTNNISDGGRISGSGTASLTIQSVAGGDQGQYTVVVGNGSGSVTSAPASLTVADPGITNQPASTVQYASMAAQFSVGAAGTSPFYYQWLKNSVPINGATSATLNLAGVSDSDAAGYSVVVSNAFGAATSSVATLQVVDTLTILAQPAGATASPGDSASFAVIAGGAGPLTYQWLKNSASISGAKGATLTLNNIVDADAAGYSVIVSNPGGSVASAAAALTVQDTLAINIQPVSRTNYAGTTATFSVRAGGAGPLTYQWFKNSQPVNGATGASLVLPNVSDGDAAVYMVLVGNPTGGVYSNPAALTVIDPPLITSQPVGSTNHAGDGVFFIVAVKGTGPFTYQWVKNATNTLGDGGNISGSTTARLILTNLLGGDTAQYTAVVRNGAGAVDSTPANLFVIDPVITNQPISVVESPGATVIFSVGAHGTTPVYQWLKNGVPISGATGATLTFAQATAADAAGYSAMVSNAFGVVTSSVALLQLNEPLAIFGQPSSQTNSVGGMAVFSVSAGGNPPMTYQWLKNTTPIGGATSAVLTLINISDADANVYRVLVSDASGSIYSYPATLTVVDPTPGNTNYAQLSFSSPMVSLNQTGAVTISLNASAGATNLSFTLDAPANLVSGMTVRSLSAKPILTSQSPPGAAHSVIVVSGIGGQVLPNQQPLLEVDFQAATNQTTAVGMLTASAVSAVETNGQPVGFGLGAETKLVLVGKQSLVEAQVLPSGQRCLILYAPPGTGYEIESSASLTGAAGWTPEFTSTPTNSPVQVFENISTNSAMRFYRVRSL